MSSAIDADDDSSKRNAKEQWLSAWVEPELKQRVLASMKRHGVSQSAIIRWGVEMWLALDETRTPAEARARRIEQLKQQ